MNPAVQSSPNLNSDDYNNMSQFNTVFEASPEAAMEAAHAISTLEAAGVCIDGGAEIFSEKTEAFIRELGSYQRESLYLNNTTREKSEAAFKDLSDFIEKRKELSKVLLELVEREKALEGRSLTFDPEISKLVQAARSNIKSIGESLMSITPYLGRYKKLSSEESSKLNGEHEKASQVVDAISKKDSMRGAMRARLENGEIAYETPLSVSVSSGRNNLESFYSSEVAYASSFNFASAEENSFFASHSINAPSKAEAEPEVSKAKEDKSGEASKAEKQVAQESGSESAKADTAKEASKSSLKAESIKSAPTADVPASQEGTAVSVLEEVERPADASETVMISQAAVETRVDEASPPNPSGEFNDLPDAEPLEEITDRVSALESEQKAENGSSLEAPAQPNSVAAQPDSATQEAVDSAVDTAQPAETSSQSDTAIKKEPDVVPVQKNEGAESLEKTPVEPEVKPPVIKAKPVVIKPARAEPEKKSASREEITNSLVDKIRSAVKETPTPVIKPLNPSELQRQIGKERLSELQAAHDKAKQIAQEIRVVQDKLNKAWFGKRKLERELHLLCDRYKAAKELLKERRQEIRRDFGGLVYEGIKGETPGALKPISVPSEIYGKIPRPEQLAKELNTTLRDGTVALHRPTTIPGCPEGTIDVISFRPVPGREGRYAVFVDNKFSCYVWGTDALKLGKRFLENKEYKKPIFKKPQSYTIMPLDTAKIYSA